ncbi:hypothetical protein JRQ81_010142 [Phrynocephalus forsythii]|uniref:Protein cramped-like n=1 Tax=Phrynocephalus forsythii TaxID=171643 RepID=A0A9Q0X7Y6_9SAUR|nr:hypothetical protein JRQ81_010142 [Phrynocephalus forsythii]
MVRRKKSPPGPEDPRHGMTVKLGDSSSSSNNSNSHTEEGPRKLGKRPGKEEEEALEKGAQEEGGRGGGGGGETPLGGSTQKEEGSGGAARGEPSSVPLPLPQAPGTATASSSSSSSSSSCAQPPHSHDQHHFLRSSVRPQSKRFRKDSQASCPVAAVAGGGGGGGGGGSSSSSGTTTTSMPAKGKGADSSGTSSSSSSGIPGGTLAGSSKSSTRNLASTPGEKEEGKKVRRQWESWSAEDKNTFFEGLYEHGKDFEAIQNNIALKYKKKSKPASMVKNKEQVRHFYYRTWHKISKYIDFDNVFSQGLKKSSLELYGLICYGELRKKIGGCMDDKNAAKLNELIQVGATTVRYKGRNLRIKAPMCRALKKLCDPEGISDEEDQKPVRLPLKVPVELQPRNNHAWARVQSLAQNPRLRMIVELHRKVSSLIEFLKQKWALHEVRIRKTLAERQAQDSRNSETRDSYPEEKATLHLFPGENCTLTPLPGVARVVHSKAFCTVHWQETGRCKQNAKDSHLLPPAQILGIQSGQGTARGQVKYPRGGIEVKGGTRTEVSTEGSRNHQSTLDATASAEDGSPEAELPELASPSPSGANHLDKLSLGLQDPERVLDRPVAPDRLTEGREAVGLATRSPSGGENCDCGSIPPDLEELSLLDPFPRYMKSCQDLIVPEKCLCAHRTNRAGSAFPGGSPPGAPEAGSPNPAPPTRCPGTSPSGVPCGSDARALHRSGPQSETGAKELLGAPARRTFRRSSAPPRCRRRHHRLCHLRDHWSRNLSRMTPAALHNRSEKRGGACGPPRT